MRPAHMPECLINCHSKFIDPQTTSCSALNIQNVALFQSLSALIHHVIYTSVWAGTRCSRAIKRLKGQVE